jgi:hypothetical protein
MLYSSHTCNVIIYIVIIYNLTHLKARLQAEEYIERKKSNVHKHLKCGSRRKSVYTNNLIKV